MVAAPNEADIRAWLGRVPDPEIPVLSITDLGIVRDVRLDDGITVVLAPTYTGCPATEVIERSVVEALAARGLDDVHIERSISPPWTTDWMTDEARDKLREYGIAPPAKGAGKRALLDSGRQIQCPCCGSGASEIVSEFGSTACKAAYRCRDCLEPFEYFKCI